MSYPWPEDKLPSFAWIKENVSPQILAVKSLHPTQYVLRIDRLQWLHDGHQPEGDDIPHVVTFEGKTWLYDGHHRWMLALLSGETHLRARNYVIESDSDRSPDSYGLTTFDAFGPRKSSLKNFLRGNSLQVASGCLKSEITMSEPTKTTVKTTEDILSALRNPSEKLYAEFSAKQIEEALWIVRAILKEGK